MDSILHPSTVSSGNQERDMAGQTRAKRTIAEHIAGRLGLGQVQTLRILQDFLDEIVGELARGNRLEFREFGVFETVMRKPRIALNPKTLEKVHVPTKLVVKFKPGHVMRQRVENLPADDGPPPKRRRRSAR